MSLEDEFSVWFRGNEDAVRFASQAWQAAQDWDDLEDEGKTQHNALIFWMGFGKEYDPYFRAHADVLRPVMLSVALQWRAADAFEAKREQLEKSYMLRAGIYGLFHMIAFIEGGYDWAEAMGPVIYTMYTETLAELREEFGCPVQQ